jgi:ATP-binding cassette subfamily G (WHITE) protein 2 (SNQ2)
MADPTPLTDIREEDITAAIPTLPGPTAAANQANVTFHNLRHHEESDVHPISSPPSPIIPRQRTRRSSSVSRVDIGHFDPQGVDELRRTLSRISANRQGDDANKSVISRSDITLAVGDGPFNFEKCLRDVVKKYAS